VVTIEAQSEREKELMDEKKRLYERFILQEINADNCHSQKAEIDEAILLLKQRRLAISSAK
jgi:hypothetical protein